MICPHCHKELGENYGASWCLFCGKDLAAPINPEFLPPSSRKSLPSRKFNWLLFFGALLGAPVLTMLSAMANHGHSNESVSVAVGLIGGGAAGITCAAVLGIRLGNTSGGRLTGGILLSLIMVPVCIILCTVGCTMSGYQMRFN